mmetsp:Transcript_1865/g.4375  ORF Transcript_1865/g.4375 Transcript_1865/m.4375 type:complete len:247 (+) Transcript_1865:273-1013(+)
MQVLWIFTWRVAQLCEQRANVDFLGCAGPGVAETVKPRRSVACLLLHVADPRHVSRCVSGGREVVGERHDEAPTRDFLEACPVCPVACHQRHHLLVHHRERRAREGEGRRSRRSEQRRVDQNGELERIDGEERFGGLVLDFPPRGDAQVVAPDEDPRDLVPSVRVPHERLDVRHHFRPPERVPSERWVRPPVEKDFRTRGLLAFRLLHLWRRQGTDLIDVLLPSRDSSSTVPPRGRSADLVISRPH